MELGGLRVSGAMNKNGQIFAVDANSFFSKPSIRTIDGLEILAKIIQPDKFEDIHVSEESFSNI